MSRPPRAGLWSAALATVVLGLTVSVLMPPPGWEGQAVWAHVAAAGGLAAPGLSFLFVGLYAWHRRPENRTGLLMTAVGFAWFLDYIGLIRTPLAFTVGLVESNSYLIVLAHLLVAFPTGTLRHRVDRVVVLAIYAWWFPSNFVTPLFFDPQQHAGHQPWQHNLLLVHADPRLANATYSTVGAINLALLVAVIVILVRHWRRATPPGRRQLAPVMWAMLPIALWVIVAAGGNWKPSDALARVLQSIGPLAMTALPVGFLVGLLRTRLGRAAVGDLVVKLGQPMSPGRFRDALAAALGDRPSSWSTGSPTRSGTPASTASRSCCRRSAPVAP